MPVIMPVAGLRLRLGGRLAAEYVSTSLASGSLNALDTLTVTTSLSSLTRSGIAIEVGALLAPDTVIVTVALLVPPCPSLAV